MRPGPACRTEDPAPAPPRRIGKVDVVADTATQPIEVRRPEPPTPPGRPPSPTQSRQGAEPGPSVGPDRDNAVDMAYMTGSVARHAACGPEAPKSVTDIVTRWPVQIRQLFACRAEIRQPPGRPLSMTTSAPSTKAENRAWSCGSAGVQRRFVCSRSAEQTEY